MRERDREREYLSILSWTMSKLPINNDFVFVWFILYTYRPNEMCACNEWYKTWRKSGNYKFKCNHKGKDISITT